MSSFVVVRLIKITFSVRSGSSVFSSLILDSLRRDGSITFRRRLLCPFDGEPGMYLLTSLLSRNCDAISLDHCGHFASNLPGVGSQIFRTLVWIERQDHGDHNYSHQLVFSPSIMGEATHIPSAPGFPIGGALGQIVAPLAGDTRRSVRRFYSKCLICYPELFSRFLFKESSALLLPPLSSLSETHHQYLRVSFATSSITHEAVIDTSCSLRGISKIPILVFSYPGYDRQEDLTRRANDYT